MKTIDPDLQADLDAGSTTLCRCWQLTRRDGTVLGFTDHDRPLSFGDVTYEADAGLTASAIEATLGLAVDGMEAAGAMKSGSLTEDDLAAGLWDGAEIKLFLVDWQNTGRRVVLFAGSVGEVARGAAAFTAELRSLKHSLNQPRGRLYQRLCDARLGDSRCGVDLDDADYSGSGGVGVLLADAAFYATGLSDFDDGLFTRGLITWTSGANDGRTSEVRLHTRAGGITTLELVEVPAFAIGLGDDFDITAGCDKTWRTCRRIFDNGVNFRGFPHMPGNDWLASPPRKIDENDGGSLFVDE